MFRELERQDDWLTEASLDLAIHRLKYRAWRSDYQVWRRWLA